MTFADKVDVARAICLGVLRMLCLLSRAATALAAVLATGPATAQPLPTGEARAKYAETREALEATRRALADRYTAGRSPRQRKAILDEARRELLSTIDERIFPAWYGTTWDFYGATEKPGTGAIACGYFVGTVLAHAGFVVDRIGLGDLASEHIASSLTSSENLRRSSDRPVSALEQELAKWGPGLYLVGLDRHAGFIVVDSDRRAHFVHSSYYSPPFSVVREPLAGRNPFAHSRYRVLARLLDDRMMTGWLLSRRFIARRR